jgi:hypothetical protein
MKAMIDLEKLKQRIDGYENHDFIRRAIRSELEYIYNYLCKPVCEFPNPPDGEQWHNPRGVTVDQVGFGYRLRLESETVGRDDDYFHNVQWKLNLSVGQPVNERGLDTYRTKEPLPKKIEMVPLECDDIVPGAVVKESNRTDGWLSVVAVGDYGVRLVGAEDVLFVGFRQLKVDR